MKFGDFMFCFILLVSTVSLLILGAIRFSFGQYERSEMTKAIHEAEIQRFVARIEIFKDIDILLDDVFCSNKHIWGRWQNNTYGELIAVEKINGTWQIVQIYYFYGGGTCYKSETNQSNWCAAQR